MKVVSSHEERAAAAKAWNRVFRSTDPFGWPFSSSVSTGRVLYPTDGCQLSREQFNAVAEMAANKGEARCYLAVVEGHAAIDPSDDTKIFVVDLSDFDAYSGLHLTLENALFSVSGAWGILISHEMHGVLGGNSALITEFDQKDQSGNEQWREFLLQWAEEKHKGWVTEIASHVERGRGDL
jgi:hypothetical protein